MFEVAEQFMRGMLFSQTFFFLEQTQTLKVDDTFLIDEKKHF